MTGVRVSQTELPATRCSRAGPIPTRARPTTSEGQSDVEHPVSRPQVWSGQVAAGREPATLTAFADEREDSQMHPITQARARIDVVRSLPEVLSASCQAFEQLLATIREHEDQAGGLFAAFVLAAASAADGRDALISASSLPLPAALARPTDIVGDTAGPAPDPARPASIEDIADALADLSQLMTTTLTRAASHAPDPFDQAACTQAARCAAAIWSLLARPGP